ncbi:MAG: NUDIX domain-containing protein [Pseudomonadota bacterium]
MFAAEVLDDAGQVKGVRPLGGTVEFGETAAAAVVREFREELGLGVRLTSQPFFMENIYTHEGETGHEIVALFEVAFPTGAFAGETRIVFREDSGLECTAAWFDVATLDLPGGPRLYPNGLKARLRLP